MEYLSGRASSAQDDDAANRDWTVDGRTIRAQCAATISSIVVILVAIALVALL